MYKCDNKINKVTMFFYYVLDYTTVMAGVKDRIRGMVRVKVNSPVVSSHQHC